MIEVDMVDNTGIFMDIPSGKRLEFAIENGEIVDLPRKRGHFQQLCSKVPEGKYDSTTCETNM